jgi:membrane-associated phospholipid phosphatase
MVRAVARRRTADLVVAGIGLVVLVICGVIASDGTVPAWEADIFHAINDLPGWLYRPLWPFQQLGTILVGPLVAIVAFVLGRRRLAIAALAATVLKLLGERVVKLLVERQRPGTTIGDVTLRGDVPANGDSFVSGHAVLAVALAAMLSPYLRGWWKLVPWVLAALNGIARIYVGAHNPLDVVGGAGLGLAIGATLKYALALGPADRAPAQPATEAQTA